MARRPTGASTGRPPRTSREEILTAARELIETQGWEQLTIRRLASAIGTSPGTVYYHVRDRDDLLVQLLNYYSSQLPRPELPSDPRERIVVAATLLHDALADMPWVAEIVTADNLLGKDILWLVEAIVAGAIDAGATPDDAVHLYSDIWYYTAGEILIRYRRNRRARLGRPNYRDEVFDHLDPGEFPRLSSLAGRWHDLTTSDTYRRGLRALVNGALPGPESPLRADSN